MGLSLKKVSGEYSCSSIDQAVQKRKQATSKKVVSFLKERAARRKDELSQEQKEQLVIEFRTKARKLARSMLRRWRSRLDLQELDSLVDLALCESVRRFDPKVGASFMTFLFHHLRGFLIRSITAAADASGYGLSDEVRRTDDFYFLGGQAINAKEIAEALSGVAIANPDELLLQKELIKLSMQARSKLDQLEADVIEKLYFDQQPLLGVADTLGYSRCHISRVKQKALDSLKIEIENHLNLESDLPKRKKRTVHRRKQRSKEQGEFETVQKLRLVAAG